MKAEKTYMIKSTKIKTEAVKGPAGSAWKPQSPADKLLHLCRLVLHLRRKGTREGLYYYVILGACATISQLHCVKGPPPAGIQNLQGESEVPGNPLIAEAALNQGP